MSESLFQLGGAPPVKQYKNVPISTSLFFSGLYTQRSPFGSPDPRYYSKVLGGRTDILIDGLNTELTNYGTLIRRPGTLAFSTASVGSAALAFFSFHPIGAAIKVIVDTATNVSVLTPGTNTSIFTKSVGAGQTYFQDVGTTLYMGSTIDQKAYPNNGTTRNWGISTGIGITSKLAGAGADDGSSANPWVNPNNVTSAVNYATNTVSTGFSHSVATNGLDATTFGYALAGGTIVSGIQVSFEGFSTTADGSGGDPDFPANSTFTVYMLKSGSIIGTSKIVFPSTSNQTFTLGSSSDLWGTSWTVGDINSATFGVAIIGSFTSAFGTSTTFEIRNVNVTVTSSVQAPTVALVGGTLVATVGFQYIYAYGNSSSGHVSNPTPPSVSIKPATNGVQISLVASTDSQVNQIRVFRTKDGGATFFELPTSPYANSTANVTDNAVDSTLQTLNFFPATTPWVANSPPPAGLGKMTYHISRIWGVVGNLVYFSALLGDDITIGVGVESFPPVNVFVFPNTVNRLLPIASGLLVFTTDNIYLISGNSRTGITGALLTSQLFQQGVGLLSYNALDVEGNQIFLYTSDRQFITFTASGPIETGYPIGVDLQNNFDPSSVYVAALISGTQDKAVFIADGSASWYRCNWNQPPEGGASWSPKANITGGMGAVFSVETSAGVHQLLLGQATGTVLARDYTVFSDNTVPYSAFATIGSLVLAKPGQLAILSCIILELKQVGSIPDISLLLDEIGGVFETLVQSVDDPPRLSPSQTVMSKRWYLSQGQDPAVCRHIQIKVSWPQEAVKNELLTLAEIGELVNDE